MEGKYRRTDIHAVRRTFHFISESSTKIISKPSLKKLSLSLNSNIYTVFPARAYHAAGKLVFSKWKDTDCGKIRILWGHHPRCRIGVQIYQ
ncbi:hypothetical protein McpSp1_15350 [Methanocorpusculaceae archaeon Sp1]|nr:hypothetical protein [Methanocorpusculaceae archaeon Sp1]